MNDPGLELLRSKLDALGAALDAGDLAAAGGTVAAYDGALRHYLEQRGRAAPVPALRELLQTQNELLSRMRSQQDRIGGELHRMKKAGAASRAYAATGAEP